MKREINRMRDRSAEAKVLRDRVNELVHDMAEVEMKFKDMLDFVEQVKRWDATREEERNKAHEKLLRREEEICRVARGLEVNRLRVQFDAILKEFKGEAVYRARDVGTADDVKLVEENISLRKKVHELQALSALQEDKISQLQNKLSEMQRLISQREYAKHSFFTKNQDKSIDLERISKDLPHSDTLNSLKKALLENSTSTPASAALPDTIFSKRRHESSSKSNINDSIRRQSHSSGSFRLEPSVFANTAPLNASSGGWNLNLNRK